jgi:hypothetical protein
MSDIDDNKGSFDVSADGEIVVRVYVPVTGGVISAKVTAPKSLSRRIARLVLAAEKLDSEEAGSK